MALPAGKRIHRVRFERRPTGADDGYGNTVAGWTPVIVTRAAFRPSFGREQIEAGRLTGTMQGTLTVLRQAATAGLTAADRVVFEAGPYAGKICQIRSIVPTAREIEMVIEDGVAT